MKSIDVDLLSLLFDFATDVAFFIKDVNGRYIAVNDSLVKRHGLKEKSTAIGKRPSEICVGDYGRLPSQQDSKVLTTGRPLIEHLEMQWQRPHRPVWCLTTKLPIRDSSENVIGLIGFSRDVSVSLHPDDVSADFAAALDHLEETLSENVTPAWLAQASNLKPQQLTRLTKRVFGLTPSQLITKVRIGAACRLLSKPEPSVAEVALACGFYDHSAFTRAFRSATGVTPTYFRKQQAEHH